MSDSDAKEGKAKRMTQLAENLGQIDNRTRQYFEELSPEKRSRIQAHSNRLQHGIRAVAPLTCMGLDRCPFAGACPIPDRDAANHPIDVVASDYPQGLPCVLENQYLSQRVLDYHQHLDIDPGNPVESAMANELAVIDLMKNRALLVLSTGDKRGHGRDLLSIDRTVIGITDSGREMVSESTKMHPAAEYLDKLEKRRERWLDKLLATRKGQADWAAKMGVVQGTSALLQDLGALRGLLEDLQTKDLELVDEELIDIE